MNDALTSTLLFLERCVFSAASLLTCGVYSMATSEPNVSSSSTSWSSFATVDPTPVLSVFLTKAGFILHPRLTTLANLMECEETQLNVVDQELRIQNFTLSVPESQKHSLRIGRIQVKWDSYSQPCLEVEAENVDVLVEFTNLLFTRNNWNELKDLGLSPKMLYRDKKNQSTTNKPAFDLENIRIGSIDIKGKVLLHTWSRPLQKAFVEMNLYSLKDLTNRIKELSEANQMKLGRRGCTFKEVHDIIKSYFQVKLREVVKRTLEDLAASRFHPKQILSSAKLALKTCAQDVKSLTRDKIRNQEEKMDRLILRSLDARDTFKDKLRHHEEKMDQLILRSLDGIKSGGNFVAPKYHKASSKRETARSHRIRTATMISTLA